VIALEDALLHPALPLLVWLMAAHAKGYTLGLVAADVVLHVVHQLAAGGRLHRAGPAQGPPLAQAAAPLAAPGR
jgi:hypothetical protein